MVIQIKIIIVTPSFHPIIGGTETTVRDFSVQLKKMGNHVDIMTFNMIQKWKSSWKENKENINGINVYRIPGLNWSPITHSKRYTFRINLIPGRFAHRLKNYDVVNFHDDTDLSFPLFSCYIRKPKILHLHSFNESYYHRYFISRYILKKSVQSFIVLSKHMKKDLMSLGVDGERIKILPNPVDTDRFCPCGEKEENLLFSAGRILETKGFHVLLKSLRYLDKPVHLIIAGPRDWSKAYFESIFKSIEAENARGFHKVTYIGAQNRANMIKWYQKASIYISPSFFESFGITNLEAMSCGTPVIATTTSTISGVIKNHENGLLVPPNDPIALSKKIQYLLVNENVRRQLGRNGRLKAVKFFSLDKVTRDLYQIYQDTIESFH